MVWAPRPSQLSEQLEDRGLNVTGAWRPVAYSRKALAHPPGVRRRLAALPSYLSAFRGALQREQPDLVHANSMFTLAEAWAARRAGSRVIFHVHEMLPPGFKGSFFRWSAGRIADEVVAVSEASARALGRDGRLPRIVHEGAPIPADVADRSSRSGPVVVGTVGVVSSRKGSDLFVEAAKRVKEAGHAVEFRMVGAPTDVLEHDWAEAVLREAAAIGIDHVLAADVPAELRGWDVFVLPSRRDPFPISMLEAMGEGLAVIGTETDGLREQIAPGTGVLVPPEDPGALAEAIVDLAGDPRRRRLLGTAARRRALESFGLERQAEELSRAYRAALARHR
jgi:glycosyltransferase involved in cell wall biosynthesis